MIKRNGILLHLHMPTLNSAVLSASMDKTSCIDSFGVSTCICILYILLWTYVCRLCHWCRWNDAQNARWSILQFFGTRRMWINENKRTKKQEHSMQKERDLVPQFETNWLICMGDLKIRLKQNEGEQKKNKYSFHSNLFSFSIRYIGLCYTSSSWISDSKK